MPKVPTNKTMSKCTLSMQLLRPVFRYKADICNICVMPPQSWGDRSDTKHSKCLLLGGRRLNQLTLIPKPKGSGGARAATAQVGPANKRNDTKRCRPLVNHRVPSSPKHKCSVLPLDLKCPEVTSRIAFIAIVTSSTFEC